MEWDEAQHFPQEALAKLAPLGFMGVVIPEEYGGAGLGHVEYVAILEELARVDASVALIVSAHNTLCAGHIHQSGNEEQKRKYLAPLARGEKIGCWSLTEPGAGSDAASGASHGTCSGRIRSAQRNSSVKWPWERRCARTFNRIRCELRKSGSRKFMASKPSRSSAIVACKSHCGWCRGASSRNRPKSTR